MENMNKENENTCPCCSNHCDRSNLLCGRGKAYFNGENPQSHGSNGDKHHGHKRPEFPDGSLQALMMQCGHKLFHGGDDQMFNVLSEEEQDLLKQLLTKMLGN